MQRTSVGIKIVSGWALVLAWAVLSAGCLPGSQRKQTNGLVPSDSASVQLAASIPADTLTLVRVLTPPASADLGVPSGILFGVDTAAVVHVIDAQTGTLHTLGLDGTYEGGLDLGFSYPYFAGRLGDTLAVWNRGSHRLDFVAAGRVVQQQTLPDAPNSAVLATAEALLLRSAGEEDGQTYLARYDRAGREQARYPLPGPYWRHIGFLRSWGPDTVLALSGYRPVADVWTPERRAGEALDTLAFVGFDSPQLNRSFRYLLGEVKEPPLLTSSAVAVGDHLFVLNLRAGWVRVDVYDRSGRLVQVFESGNQAIDLQFFPVDLDVRVQEDGRVLIALLLKSPTPSVWLLEGVLRSPTAV